MSPLLRVQPTGCVFRTANVVRLRSFVAATQQQNHDALSPRSVDAVARAIVDAQLEDLAAHFTHVPEQARLQPTYPHRDARFRLRVL